MLVVRDGTSCTPKQREHAEQLMALLTEEEKELIRHLLFDWQRVGMPARQAAKDIIQEKGFPRNTARGLYDLRREE